MSNRVDIKAILADHEQRKELLVGAGLFMQHVEGIDTTPEQMATAYDDVHRFRFTIICKCMSDYVQAYGATADEARVIAEKIYRRNHGRRKPLDTVLEKVTDDGSHYEEVS